MRVALAADAVTVGFAVVAAVAGVVLVVVGGDGGIKNINIILVRLKS